MVRYKKIANDMINKIETKKYPIGSTIPSEKEMMDHYQCSRDTIRKAVDILVHLGYVLKTQGRQSIVLNLNKFNFSIANVHSFKEVSQSLPNKITSQVIKIEKLIADDRLQHILNLNDDDYYWHLQRVRLIDGVKIIFDEDFISTKNNIHFTDAILENSIYEYLENELGMSIAFASKEITVEKINDNDCQYLDLDGHQTMAVVRSYTYLENGELFQYTQSRHRSDRFIFNTFARRFK